MESHGIKTVTGKVEWSTSTIDRMLSNEKYIGHVLMQKTYTPDFLTGRQVKNQGELAKYLVEDAHEPIIDKETFDKVQRMKGRIKKQEPCGEAKVTQTMIKESSFVQTLSAQIVPYEV